MTDKHAVIGAGIPKAMAEAILAAQADMPSLRKGERNQFAKYNFVGVDTFLEEIPPVAAKHGLFWQPRELSFEIAPDCKHVATSYAFDLFYKDGTCLPEYGKITVVHPLQGAQTSGSSLAYAEKMFCRFAFKIVTGEEDADSTDNTKQEAPRPRPVPIARPVAPPMSHAEAQEKGLIPKTEPKPMGEIIGGIAEGGVKVTEKDGVPVVAGADKPDGWDMVAKVFETFVPQCSTAEELNGFWMTNIGTLDKMKEQDDVTYTRVKKAFTARKTAITKAANKETV